MTTSDRIDLVERYVHELAIALADLPGVERDDVIAGVREHIDASLAGRPDPSVDEVQRVLDDLGDPLVIAADAGAQPSAATPGSAATAAAPVARTPLLQRDWVPAATVLSLTFGALLFWLIVPIAFWVVGLVLLWLSPLWRVGEKVLGTFVLGIVPFVYGFLGVFAWTMSGGSPDCVSEPQVAVRSPSPGSVDTSTGGSVDRMPPGMVCTSDGSPWAAWIFLGLVLAAIIGVAVLLWRRGAARVPPSPVPAVREAADEPIVRA